MKADVNDDNCADNDDSSEDIYEHNQYNHI